LDHLRFWRREVKTQAMELEEIKESNLKT
jgi:hypothetical protein